MRAVLWVGAGLLAILVALFSYVLITDDGPPIIRRTVDAVREITFPTTDRPAISDVTEETPVVPVTGRPGSRPSSADPPPASAPGRPARSSAPPPAERPPLVFTRGAAPPAAPKPLPRRTDFYLPGSVANWTNVDVVGGVAMRLRAGGLLSTQEDSSGPEGLRSSAFESALARRRATGNVRVMSSGPYLALIGRVCTGELCSEPFVVGSTKLLCPSDFAAEGRLQLWTNNYVQLDGTRTVNRFSSATGGYAVYAEPASPSACETPAGPSVSAPDTAVIMAGQVLRKPEFVISSSQTSWKPFFLPLNVPLRLTASGSMQPRGGARSTGPEGIIVPNQSRWTYPGTSDLVVDGESRLYDARFPYQALIGRVCGEVNCGQPFLVGSQHVVCASGDYTDRLELWINHIMRPEGLLGTQLSVSMEAFELQGRRGEYRFEVARAPAGACGG
jgi:hypothetical protein